MKKTDEWKVFEQTGRIEDYLAYCKNKVDEEEYKLQAGGIFETGDFGKGDYTANGTSG